ncbi:hypothetical protein R1flu_020736 [Riccia fluitans]|uniref:non-specific serine/threonine protein kinase n=1 Tax=Riccia fluitans TaxID=41844 RepID=A0ABD1ZMJ3_9MARC
MTVSRLNFGGNASEPPLRYPSDMHDRLWYPAGPDDTTQPNTFKPVVRTKDRDVGGNENWDYPAEVELTAWEGRNAKVNITFTFNVSASRALRPIPTFYLSLKFLDVNSQAGRYESVYLDDEGSEVAWGEEVHLQYPLGSTWWNYNQIFDGGSPIFIVTPNTSVTPPTSAMISGCEVLGEFEAETQRTLQADVITIKNFTDSLGEYVDIFVDTAGDPCLPAPWNWIVCSIESPPRITQINITSIGASGTVPSEFGTLDRLTALDISNNSFRGELPQSLASIRTLRELNCANNKLFGVLPEFKENTSLLNLEILSLRNNTFTGNLSSLFSALGPKSAISKIYLGYNNFTGTLPKEIGALKNLQVLDLSWNNLTLTKGENVIDKLINSSTHLKTLNLQGNHFMGAVPAEIWTSGSLETVDLSDNQFETLNLTAWCSIVEKGGKEGLSAFKQKVNLRNNSIKNVLFPCQDVINKLRSPKDTDSWIQLNSASAGFILLRNNDYCKDIGSNPNRARRYICRATPYENFWNFNKSENKKVIIIASVICGVFVLLTACILLVVVRRMWKRMKDLRKIQEALAREDVRPPFFKYDELKSASGDFSEENKLGQGAFGAVYKAVLPDKSIVAVKLLEPTDQNITDFLNEMVLITGIKHKHLIQLKGCCVRDRKRLLVYEYAENKNLADALWGLERTYGLNWDQRFKICLGVAKGLCYLHEELQPKIIHRDIKAQNILLDKNWEPKIADFGLALPMQEQSTSGSTQVATRIGGTLGYFSPEYATSGKVTEKLDVYSFGILVLEILAGRKCIDLSLTYAPEQIYLKDWAFHKYTEGKILDIVEKGVMATGSTDQILGVVKTALSCLQENHEKRPCMSQVVNMLVGQSPDDVALDIIGQLKDQERMYQGLFDASFKGNKGTQDLRHGLLQSTDLNHTSSNDAQSIMQMSVTKPR